jgi:hypothetical protein
MMPNNTLSASEENILFAVYLYKYELQIEDLDYQQHQSNTKNIHLSRKNIFITLIIIVKMIHSTKHASKSESVFESQ